MSFIEDCFFIDTPTTQIYTLSLHDALPISVDPVAFATVILILTAVAVIASWVPARRARSEEHTSELQSHVNLVCRLLLEKKKLRGRHHHLGAADLGRRPQLDPNRRPRLRRP